jgi:hypothetical protein
MTRLRSLFFIVVLMLIGGVYAPTTTQAQSDVPITYERYDVEIEVATDGSFLVREIQQIRFDGNFRTAFAEIPLAYTETITDVVVYEGDTPYREERFINDAGEYSWENTGSNIVVEWQYLPTYSGLVKTFVLEYRVEGGLWVYDDEYTLEWRAIPGDRSGVPIEASAISVRLPTTPEMDTLRFAAFGAEYEATANEGEVRFAVQEPLPDGNSFQVLVAFPKTGITAEKQPYQLREEQDAVIYRFEALDVEMFISETGLVTIEESHRISVLQGQLRRGERVIPLAYTDGITNVQVFEGEVPLTASVSLCEDCFTVAEENRQADWIRYDEERNDIRINEREAGQARILWDVPPLVPGEATTFRIRYDVPGLIISDESAQRFDWNVVFDTRRVEEGAGERVLLQEAPPIESATIRLHLPDGTLPENVTIGGSSAIPQPDGTILLTYEGTISPGTAWEIQVGLPPDATTASIPTWQRAFESARQAQADAAARFAQQQFGLGAGGVITLVGGLVGSLVLWFTRGRDREVPLQAEYLSEPPSDLPPGIVAYLVDEKPTTKGVLASLFHLATLGLIQISIDSGIRLQRNLDETELYEGQEMSKADGTSVTIPRHLLTLYNTLAPHIPTDTGVSLSTISGYFVKVLPAVYEQMGQEASQFFSEIPTKAEFRWKSFGQGLILMGVIGTAIAYFTVRETWGDVVLWIPGAFAVVGIAFWVVSRWMAQKTTLGAEEASKWEAFKRYLQNLKQYGTLTGAQKILDEHFAYAVALDVEEVVLQQSVAMGTTDPVWTYPTTVRRDSPIPSQDMMRNRPTQFPPLRTIPTRPGTPASSPSGDGWSVQGASDTMARAINNADNGLATFLNRAGGVDDGTTPFDVVRSGVEGVSKATFSATKTTFEILGDILESSSSGGGGGGYSGGSSSRRSSSSWGRSSSSSRSSRSSGSRRSGGGGRRGFG